MFIDKELEFSDAQAVTSSAASSNAVDLGSSRDIGIGEALYLVIQVDTTVTAAGSASVMFTLQTDTVDNFATPTGIINSDAIGKDLLTAGTTPVVARLPHGVERYLRIYYSVGTGPLTAGAFTAFLTKDAQAWRAQASGYTTGT